MSTGARTWRAGSRMIDIDRPVVVGIVNVTPDSFSDGGLSFFPERAVARGLELLAGGADLLDVGGESTRPGAEPVSVDDELARVIPIIEQLRREAPEAILSVDTVKAAVAEAALSAGADVVNDVSGHTLDAGMSRVCAAAGCGVVIMHSRGSVSEMASYVHATYDDVVGEVCAELSSRLKAAESAGVARESIVVDPGIGFSKRGEHSMAVLRGLSRVTDLGYPVQVGVSRKRIIGELSGVSVPAERDFATVGANVFALMMGARLFRVHNARATSEALDVAWHLMGERG